MERFSVYTSWIYRSKEVYNIYNEHTEHAYAPGGERKLSKSKIAEIGTKVLEALGNTKKKTMGMGDLNINWLCSNDSATRQYKQSVAQMHFLQIVGEPTRQLACLDHVLRKGFSPVACQVKEINIIKTDHKMIKVKIGKEKGAQKQKFKVCTLTNKEDSKIKFKECSFENLEEGITQLVEQISIIESHFTIENIKKCSANWYKNTELRKLKLAMDTAKSREEINKLRNKRTKLAKKLKREEIRI